MKNLNKLVEGCWYKSNLNGTSVLFRYYEGKGSYGFISGKWSSSINYHLLDEVIQVPDSLIEYEMFNQLKGLV